MELNSQVHQSSFERHQKACILATVILHHQHLGNLIETVLDIFSFLCATQVSVHFKTTVQCPYFGSHELICSHIPHMMVFSHTSSGQSTTLYSLNITSIRWIALKYGHSYSPEDKTYDFGNTLTFSLAPPADEIPISLSCVVFCANCQMLACQQDKQRW